MSETKRSGDRIIVKPGQDVVSSTAKAFREELLGLIDHKNCEIEIDLSDVELVDSVGLGVFIATHNALKKIEGRLVVSGASENIFNLFKTMGLYRHFKVIARPAAS